MEADQAASAADRRSALSEGFGVFLRGDTAAYYAMALRQVLHPNGEDVDAMTGALARIQLRGLLRILEASDERTHTPNVRAKLPAAVR